MAKSNDGAMQKTAKALAHPLRVRILEEMGDGEASPNQLRQVLDEPLGNVSYHMKELVEFGAIAPTKTEPRRGAVEHFYRRTGAIVPVADANGALDRIAEVLEAPEAGGPQKRLGAVREILKETGREV